MHAVLYAQPVLMMATCNQEQGCDASLLINPTSTQETEKTASPNLSVRGYAVIDNAKAQLESVCPLTVSCADITALATRDAVALSGGPKYALPTGRRDGLVSSADDVALPGPSFTVDMVLPTFTSKGLTLEDMVVLLGAHSVGVAHCGFFRDRLFNFQGTGRPDPTMDAAMRGRLAGICGSSNLPMSQDPTVALDQGTQFVVDNQFYQQIAVSKGVMLIDQELATDNSTAGIVAQLRKDNSLFLRKFAAAMVKLGGVGVLQGSQGEIRKICGSFN